MPRPRVGHQRLPAPPAALAPARDRRTAVAPSSEVPPGPAPERSRRVARAPSAAIVTSLAIVASSAPASACLLLGAGAPDRRRCPARLFPVVPAAPTAACPGAIAASSLSADPPTTIPPRAAVSPARAFPAVAGLRRPRDLTRSHAAARPSRIAVQPLEHRPRPIAACQRRARPAVDAGSARGQRDRAEHRCPARGFPPRRPRLPRLGDPARSRPVARAPRSTDRGRRGRRYLRAARHRRLVSAGCGGGWRRLRASPARYRGSVSSGGPAAWSAPTPAATALSAACFPAAG